MQSYLGEIIMETTEETPQQRRVAAFEANGWEISHYMDKGIVVMKRVDVSPNGRETPLKAHIDGNGSSVII